MKRDFTGSRLIDAFLILLLSLIAIQANPVRLMAEGMMGIGMAWAPIAGNGFSFRNMPSQGWGYQCGTVFWKSGDDGYVNFGVAGLYFLKRSDRTALYAPVGVGFTYHRNSYMEFHRMYGDSTYLVKEEISALAAGAGLGLTVRTGNWEDVWFSLDLVMMAEKSNILPMPQFGIHYYFR